MMTVDVTGSRQADLLVKKSHDLGLVVSNIGQDMRSERWTDVTLYSRERIPLSVHRFILWQSPYLQTILRSQSCCRGQCGHQASLSILLPDVSYPHLLQVINFLYTGLLQSSQRDRDHILVIIASSELRDNIIIQSLVELLGFGSNISVDTSEDQEIVIEDEDDIALDISNGDDDASFPESRGNVSSPSHSGGITSPEVDPLQDFETDSEDDSSEDVRTNDVNALEIEDPYLFIASPVVSRGIENKRKEKRKVKSSEPSHQSGSARDKKCKNCKVRVSALTFKKHIVTHLYDKWPEVGPDTTHCNLCDKTLQGQKYLINHLATVHHQLEEKLAEDGETVESYEMEIVEETGADSVDTVSNNLVQAMELESSVLFTGEENRESPGDDNDSDATVPCSPQIMGVKRKAARLEDVDKKARNEAGLVLSGLETEQVMVEQVLREVKAPNIVQTNLDNWTGKVASHLATCQLQKVSSLSNIKNFPSAEVEDVGFPGGKVTSCTTVGPLKTKSLVFPKAVGRLVVKVKLARSPDSPAHHRSLTRAVLAYLKTSLETSAVVSPLVSSLRYSRDVYTEPELVLLVVPSPKWGKHFTLEVSASLSSPARAESNLQTQLDQLTGQQPYLAASAALEVWRRQVSLELPRQLLPCLLLHCQETKVISSTSKSWQIVKKVWALLAGLELTGHQLILGLSSPVPTAEATSSPLLDREAQSPLFPGLARPQWAALIQFASRAVNQTVETALLRTIKPEALYDRVYELRGEMDVFSLMNNLARALEDRVTLLTIVRADTTDNAQLSLHVGVKYQPELYWKPVSMGPQANSSEAASWRQFWGERSELRRFQDGEVREVVSWPADRERVVTEVVTCVVARHHKLCVLQSDAGDWPAAILQGDGGTAARALVDRLTPVLYNLQLSLKVAGVTALGPAARGSRVSPDLLQEPGGKTVREEGGVAKISGKTGMAPRYVEPLDVLLMPEHSGKWPKDPEALRRVRLAWLLEVGEKLEAAVGGLVSRVREETLVVMVDSLVLGLRLGQRTEECEISSWLAGLDRSQPAWSGAARLVKRWAAAHLMSSVPELALEVSLAVVLARATLPPSSPAPAFLCWLQSLASHDWNNSPLCHPACSTNLPARSSLPPMAVLCPHSPRPSHWTKDVTWPQLQRLVSLASQSVNNNNFHVQTIFSPNLASYEALIHLKPLQVPTRHLCLEAVLGHPPLKSDQQVRTVPILDHDPVRILVETLTSCYGHLAQFHYDRYGGKVIAVKILEKPSQEATRVKLSEVGGRMLQDGKTLTNWGAVVEDWAILGEGIVKNVEILNTDLLLV